jgi:hypothetical protein
MAVNYPGPLELRINYSVTVGSSALNHQQRLNVDPVLGEPDVGVAFDTIDVKDIEGYAISLNDLIDDWIAVLQPLYNATCTWTDVEAWWYTPLTNDAHFISAYSIGLTGSAGGANIPAGQVVYTFRTQEGGILRINLMEAAPTTGNPKTYAVMTANEQAVVDFVLTDTTGRCFLGKDTSYPFSVNKMFPGQNEALFRRRYRITE